MTSPQTDSSPSFPPAGQPGGHRVFSLTSLLGFLGYSSFAAWVMGLFFFGEFSLLLFRGGYQGQVIAIAVFSCSLTVLFMLARLLSNWLVRQNWVRGIGVTAIAALFLSLAMPTLYAKGLALAIVYLCLSLLWAIFLGSQKWVFRHSAGALIVGGVLCMLGASLNETGAFILLLLLPICSLVLFFVLLPTLLRKWEFVSTAQSAERYLPHISGIVTTVCDGFLAGLGLYCILIGWEGWGESLSGLSVGICVAMIGTALIIDDVNKMQVTENLLLKTYSIRMMPALFFLCFLPQYWIGIIGCYLLSNTAVHLIRIIATTAEQTRFNQLNQMFSFGTSKSFVFGGFTAGWLVGYIALDIASQTEYLRILMFFSILLVLLVFSTFLFQDNFHLGEPETDTQIAESHVADSGSFKHAVTQTATEYGLSSRQTEVLFLLARGRNARYIQQQFYISRATAKAHIYSIYRKTNTHSQQGLIDLIESKWKKH